jgi:hypothetical protein
MKYDFLNKASDLLLRRTSEYLTKIAKLPKVKDEGQQKAIFDSWVGLLDPSTKNIIKTVFPRQSVFKPQKGKPPRSDAPVCIIESTMAIPDANYFSKKPTFVFRFGMFTEQPYKSIEEQKAYALSLLKKYTTYSDQDMYVEYVPLDNIDYNIVNSAYEGGIAVFFKEIEEDDEEDDEED